MVRNLFKAVILLSPMALLVGCGTLDRAYMATRERVQDFEVRTYMQDKLRIDQDMNGNAGYIVGAPKEVDRSKYKETRKTYVLEVTEKGDIPKELLDLDLKEPSNLPVRSNSIPPQASQKQTVKREVIEQKINIPDLDSIQIDEDEALPKSAKSTSSAASQVSKDASGSYLEYVVEKNDTLQKISKKFYDGYSKWPRIYEANKATLKSPDALKAGMTLKIPVDQK